MLDDDKARKKMNAFCNNIADSLQIGLMAVHRNGELCYVNESFTRMFGIDHENSIGRNIRDFFPEAELLKVMSRGDLNSRVRFRHHGVDALISRYSVFDGDAVIGGFVEVYFRDIEELQTLLSRIAVLEKRAKYHERRNQGLPGAEYSFDDFIGSSQPVQILKQQALRFANNNQPVLIIGESGTGKEIVAHALHASSARANEVLVTVNCAAVPSQLMEAELFGYEDGAFTGARRGGRIGKFELADRGSIFLDEIGEMPLDTQAKLLRVLENREIQKIGLTEPIYSDFRLIAATNRDLLKMVDEGKFREDLYHRLNILHLNIPPLRDRIEDLDLLIPHLVARIEKEDPVLPFVLDESAMNCLRSYRWPGNVRELKNVLIYTMFNLDAVNKRITSSSLPHHISREIVSPPKTTVPTRAAGSLQEQRQELLRQAITKALHNCNGNKTRAARELGISRNELYKKLKKLNIIWPADS